MILLGWAGVVVLMASLLGAIIARRRVWGLRLAPATPARKRPHGTVLVAAGILRGARMEVTPLLADWHARGVLDVSRSGPDMAGDTKSGAASGPEWIFTVLDPDGVSAVELPVLQTFVRSAPTRGATARLTREDKKSREAIAKAISDAVTRQRREFGPRPRSAVGLAVLLIAVAGVAGVAAVAGFALGGAAPTPIALAFVGSGAAIGMVILLCRGGRRPSDAEREYRQDVRNLEAWVKSTADPDPSLAGWALLWDLPGAWSTTVAPEITGLRSRDRAFLPGDFSKQIASTTSL